MHGFRCLAGTSIRPYAHAVRLVRQEGAVCRSKHWLSLLLVVIAISLYAQTPSTLQSAHQAMDAKDYAAAERLYRKALAQAPSSAQVQTALGLSLQMQGRSADAMHYYSLALKQQYVPETYALLAEERCRMGEVDSLKPMLDKIYNEERKNVRVLSAVAPCYLNVGKAIESVEIYQELVGSGNYPADLALIQLAKSFIQSGELFVGKLSKVPGSQLFLEALRQAPTSGPQGARSAFAEAAQISPYFRSDLNWSEAVERWRQHPKDAALLYLLSVLSAEEGMHQIELCDESYSTSPYLELFHADVLADQGQGDEAVSEYEELIRKDPGLPDVEYSLGMLYEKRSEWDKAAQAFRQQLAQFPKDERASKHLSGSMLQMGQYAELRDFLQPQMQVEHPPQWASLDLAEAQQKLGNPDAAIHTLVAAEHDPGSDKVVHYRLMHLYSATGHTADAKREYALFQAETTK
jgi:tetratricopeptide (TPR) repeat protein